MHELAILPYDDRTIMLENHNRYSLFIIALCLAVWLILSSCSAPRLPIISEPDTKTDRPLSGRYQTLIVHDFETDERLGLRRPYVATACESATLNELMRIGSIPRITKGKSVTQRQKDALILKIYISAPVSGKRDLTAEVRLIDAYTGITLRETRLPASQGTAAGMAHKAKKTQTPDELGKGIARYVTGMISPR